MPWLFLICIIFSLDNANLRSIVQWSIDKELDQINVGTYLDTLTTYLFMSKIKDCNSRNFISFVPRS